MNSWAALIKSGSFCHSLIFSNISSLEGFCFFIGTVSQNSYINLLLKQQNSTHTEVEYHSGIESNGYFIATFRLLKKVGETERAILEEIQKNEYVTYQELAVLIGISEKSIYKNIEKLKEKGILKRIGPAKGGHWEAVK